jgi:glycosyltransferase involved in cell wall biosynthesis
LKVWLCSTGELFGGVEQFVYTYACHLSTTAASEVAVVLFCKGALFDQLQARNIETHLVAPRAKYDLAVILRVAQLLRAKGPSIVHTHGYKANILCGLAARLAGYCAVKTEHGALEPSPRKLDRLKMRFNLAIDAVVSRHFFSHVVFVSNETRDAKSGSYPPKMSSVIYNGIPDITVDEEFDCPSPALGRFRIGVVGRLTEVKGHRFLLEAMRTLRTLDLHLFIYGDGPLESPLRSLVQESHLSDRVSFMGFRQNVHSQVGSLDLVVMPSLQEGFPYTMLECAYLGVPVVASNVGGIREVFENGVDCLLVPPSDPSALAAAIAELHGNRERRLQLAASARRKTKSRFTIEQMAKQYAQVYQDLFPAARVDAASAPNER